MNSLIRFILLQILFSFLISVTLYRSPRSLLFQLHKRFNILGKQFLQFLFKMPYFINGCNNVPFFNCFVQFQCCPRASERSFLGGMWTMVAHCYHSKTSWRCFLNLKRKENKAYGCDKKIKKKQIKLKKIIRRKTNWAKILKIIVNDLFEQII